MPILHLFEPYVPAVVMLTLAIQKAANASAASPSCCPLEHPTRLPSELQYQNGKQIPVTLSENITFVGALLLPGSSLYVAAASQENARLC